MIVSTRDLALILASAGWYVFPLASKVPRIKGGWSVGFNPTEMLAPWAREFVEKCGPARWRLAEHREGSYWATLHPKLIDAQFEHVARVAAGQDLYVGITSNRLIIDIDEPEHVDADIAKWLSKLPHLKTPGGGNHFFASTGAGERWQVGPLRTPDGLHFGDLKHLSKSYSVAYPGVPALDDVNSQPDPRVNEWLREARRQKAAPAERVVVTAPDRPRRGVCLKPSTYTNGSRTTPESLVGVVKGVHDTIKDGTMQDAIDGVDRREEWVEAAVATERRDRQTAITEVDRLMDGAQELVEAERADKAQVSELQAKLAAAEAKLAEAARRAELQKAFSRNPKGYASACAAAGYPVAMTEFGNVLVQDAGVWAELLRGDPVRELVCGEIGDRFTDSEGKPLKFHRNNDEWRMLVRAAHTRRVTVREAFPRKIAQVAGWFNAHNDGAFKFDDVITSVGLVDRYVGAAKSCTPVNCAIVRLGAGDADADWIYSDVRVGGKRRASHGDRWHIRGRIPGQSDPPA